VPTLAVSSGADLLTVATPARVRSIHCRRWLRHGLNLAAKMTRSCSTPSCGRKSQRAGRRQARELLSPTDSNKPMMALTRACAVLSGVHEHTQTSRARQTGLGSLTLLPKFINGTDLLCNSCVVFLMVRPSRTNPSNLYHVAHTGHSNTPHSCSIPLCSTDTPMCLWRTTRISLVACEQRCATLELNPSSSSATSL
jgi:hypothetical protein